MQTNIKSRHSGHLGTLEGLVKTCKTKIKNTCYKIKNESLQNRSGSLKSQVMIIEAFASFEFDFVAYMNRPSQNFLLNKVLDFVVCKILWRDLESWVFLVPDPGVSTLSGGPSSSLII